VLPALLAHLRSPVEHAGGLAVLPAAEHVVDASGWLVTATLVGPHGKDPSCVVDGIWEAMGRNRRQRSLAQLANSVPPEPQLYQRFWRPHALGWLSGRPFPPEEELGELDAALGDDLLGAVVVDVGCSEGHYARHLAARGALVVALDHSRAFLRRAQRHATRDGVSIAAVHALAQDLPVRDGHADAVVIGGTLNEIGDVDGALAEVRRALRTDGVLFSVSLVQTTGRAGRALQTTLRRTGIEFPGESETLAAYEANGLRVVDARRDGIVLRTRCAPM
jgi:2-polyprenyl-3-methyl-5-hydroxy-6-metoxy-1,4-benzoquinol methylase